jgi:hypothetical protein
MKTAVFWAVTPCSLVEVYQHFRAIIALMMEALSTSETLLNFYQTTLRYNPKDSHLHTRHRENLNSAVMIQYLHFITRQFLNSNLVSIIAKFWK